MPSSPSATQLPAFGKTPLRRMNGRPAAPASRLPRKIDSTAEVSFCLRSSSVMAAKATPLARAVRLPAKPANCRLSQKNSVMPPNTAAMVSQSTRVARSPRNHAPSSAIHTGAVYWSRMALAAVVSLLAVTNRMVVAA